MNRSIPWQLGLSLLVLSQTAVAQMPPTLVETDSVRKMEFHDQITLVGRTQAIANSRIVAEVSGHSSYRQAALKCCTVVSIGSECPRIYCQNEIETTQF